MTVVVGYLAGRVGLSGLHLGVRVARTLKTSLTVVTIVPRPWLTPSRGRVDAEYEQFADQLAADSAAEAQRQLRKLSDGLEVSYRYRAHRSVSGGLIEIVEESDAEILVLGSLPSARRGQVVIGSTADWLLHSSRVPVAISPRGYRAHAAGLTQLTCAYAATPEAVDVVRRCTAVAQRFGVPMRVLTFAVRGKAMYQSGVGLDAEDSIVEAWASQALAIQDNLKIDGIVAEEVVLQVVTAKSWRQALRATGWQDGEILALGTSPRGDMRRVFLGSRSAKIIRHSPVPVLVLPG